MNVVVIVLIDRDLSSALEVSVITDAASAEEICLEMRRIYGGARVQKFAVEINAVPSGWGW